MIDSPDWFSSQALATQGAYLPFDVDCPAHTSLSVTTLIAGVAGKSIRVVNLVVAGTSSADGPFSFSIRSASGHLVGVQMFSSQTIPLIFPPGMLVPVGETLQAQGLGIMANNGASIFGQYLLI